MSDRDRLAADLHATHICVEMPDGRCITDHAGVADRLIALGWTRLNPDSLSVLDGVPHTHPDGFPCLACGRDAVRSARNTLDEERLTRALTEVQGGRYESWLRRAPLIAKAYREDTNATD